jgi:lysophospholipase L1-like esterase
MQAPIYRSSEVLPWELLPNSRWTWTVGVPASLGPEFYRDIEINSLGYREREFSWAKPPDTYRVLLLGDSYALGWGVRMEDSVGRQLESLLQARLPDRKVEVINAAFACGYSPDTYYAYLKRYGLSLAPDLVLSTFVPRNDLKEVYSNVRIPGENGLPDRVISKIDSVDDRTHLRRRVFPSRVPLQLKRMSALLDWSVKRLRPLVLGPGDQDALRFLRNPLGESYGSVWPATIQCLAETHRLLQSQSPPIPYLVIIAPEAHEIHPELWQPLGLTFDRELYLCARPQEVTVRMAKEAGFPCLDLLPGLRKFAVRERLYFNSHGHWNPAGHRRAAELTAHYLNEVAPAGGRMH